MQQCKMLPHVGYKIPVVRLKVLLKTTDSFNVGGNEFITSLPASTPSPPPFLYLFILRITADFTPFTLSSPMKINSYRIKRFFSLSPLLSPLSDVASITSDTVIESGFI